MRVAKVLLTELAESLGRESRPCGFLKVVVAEAGAVEEESSTHLSDLLLKVLDGNVKTMKPLAVVKAFHDPTKGHWLDEFDGDAGVDAVIGAFVVEAVFTFDPAKFHLAIDGLEKAFDRIIKVYELFSLVKRQAVIDAETVFNRARVTKLETQVIGILHEMAEKPVRLKRAFNNVYENTPDHVWTACHPILTGCVEKYASKVAAAKKSKAG